MRREEQPQADRVKTQMLAKLTKLEVFDPNDKGSHSWRDWRVVSEAHCNAISEGASRWMEAAAAAADEQSVNDNIPMTAEAGEFNRALRLLFIMLCRNEALILVTNAKRQWIRGMMATHPTFRIASSATRCWPFIKNFGLAV